jgi:hypothetical protein
VLLDVMLGKLGITPSSVEGYAREEPTHLAVAAAIASGRADAGMGIMAAARAFGLDFVPLAVEPYDLVVAPGAMESPQLAPLWSLLQSDRFKASVEELGGYSTKEMGRRLRLGFPGLGSVAPWDPGGGLDRGRCTGSSPGPTAAGSAPRPTAVSSGRPGRAPRMPWSSRSARTVRWAAAKTSS